MPTSRSNKPLVAITMGDPSGIGLEVILKALASLNVSKLADFFVIGDGSVIDMTKRALKLKADIPLLDLANIPAKDFAYGISRPSFGKASIEYIDKALELLNENRIDAMVTGPVNKSSINAGAVKNFKGHTEYLAKKTLTKDYAMMFVSDSLKITLVTRHIAMKDVPKAISVKNISKTIFLTHKYLKKYFGIRHPKIGVAGLNPHAGESGLIGKEELTIIGPAVKAVSKYISGVRGPVVPDVIFYEALNKKFDAVVAMYHDQALIPFKMLYFANGVNLTLGLPFVRTSPDHGTAFDIAGKMTADPSSMRAAIILAARLAKR